MDCSNGFLLTLNLKNNYRKKSKLYECQLLETVNILSITEKLRYFTLHFVFQALKSNLNIEYITDMFVLKPSSRTRAGNKATLCSNYDSKLKVFEKSIKFRGINEWNKLPKEICDLDCSKTVFLKKLSSYIVNSRTSNEVSVYYPP
jgi:hypothetical protein